MFNKSSSFNTISCTCTPYPGHAASSPRPMPLRIRCCVFYSCFSHGILFQSTFYYIIFFVGRLIVDLPVLLFSWLDWRVSCPHQPLKGLEVRMSLSALVLSQEMCFCCLSSRGCDVFFRTSAVWWSLLVDGARMSVTSSLAGCTAAVWMWMRIIQNVEIFPFDRYLLVQDNLLPPICRL